MTDTTHAAAEAEPSTAQQLLRLAIEIGPLIAFFITYSLLGIFWATGVSMVATIAATIASYLIFKKIAAVPIVTAAIVCVFGGLTFWLNDPRFFYVKPTMINLLFAGVLGAGLLSGRPLIKLLFGEHLKLTDAGWRQLTIRWMLFFVAMAALNEFVWRSFSEATWASFKVFGILPLTAIFALAQTRLIARNSIETT